MGHRRAKRGLQTMRFIQKYWNYLYVPIFVRNRRAAVVHSCRFSVWVVCIFHITAPSVRGTLSKAPSNSLFTLYCNVLSSAPRCNTRFCTTAWPLQPYWAVAVVMAVVVVAATAVPPRRRIPASAPPPPVGSPRVGGTQPGTGLETSCAGGGTDPPLGAPAPRERAPAPSPTASSGVGNSQTNARRNERKSDEYSVWLSSVRRLGIV